VKCGIYVVITQYLRLLYSGNSNKSNIINALPKCIKILTFLSQAEAGILRS